MSRITPELITELKVNEVFIFGSNLQGLHGAGAARQALQWGAEYGNPIGRQGRTYAIPTKDFEVIETLSVDEIRPYVNIFIEHAKQNPETIFYVTEIGCGLATRTHAEVGPLFTKALDMENVYLPQKFIDYIK